MKYADKKIGKLVADNYRFATVFRKFGIDFCCGGGRTLGDVCLEESIELNTVIEQLESSASKGVDEQNNFNNHSLTDLTNHIINTHHFYIREAIPPLVDFTQKVSRTHGDRLPEVNEIARQFILLSEELIIHLEKEETILFPYIFELESRSKNGLSFPDSPFGSIANPISVLDKDHEASGDIMKKIRNLTNNFVPPVGACMTHQVSYKKLQEFEEDIHKHMHLENNILFPKAIELENNISITNLN